LRSERHFYELEQGEILSREGAVADVDVGARRSRFVLANGSDVKGQPLVVRLSAKDNLQRRDRSDKKKSRDNSACNGPRSRASTLLFDVEERANPLCKIPDAGH